MVKGSGFEVAALGAGSLTLTAKVPTDVKSVKGTTTAMDVGLTVAGIRTFEPKFTTAPLTKPVPVMVR